MKKNEIGPRTFIYPMPVTLVGANVNGKPNFTTIGYCGAINHNPPMISVGINQKHYIRIGMNQNKTFSVNIPSSDMVKITDYCGVVSGHKVDKSQIFEVFNGKLENAPMIAECPLNLECKVVQTILYPMQEVFIGEVIAAYAEDKFLTNGLPDIKKMKALVFSMHDNNYWTIGENIGKAWSIGNELKDKLKE
ncbi:MAG: flavin reductase family protein [Syntrophaceae bacterium]|nr:flavin reductase family protein [Syntrophaceae bacterium]